ncbi:hypothetical protein ACVWWN_004872 [Mycobacterium sp. URHB0021]|jgi:hypothetical protein
MARAEMSGPSLLAGTAGVRRMHDQRPKRRLCNVSVIFFDEQVNVPLWSGFRSADARVDLFARALRSTTHR